MALTDTTVKNAKPKEKDYKLTDEKACTFLSQRLAVSLSGLIIALLENVRLSLLAYIPKQL